MPPYHLGIIPDGNRRWAKEKGLPTFEGHRRGLAKFKQVAKWCKKRGVKIITIFGFSTENWARSPQEVNYLMRLFSRSLIDNIGDFTRDGVRIKILGQKNKLPKFLRASIKKTENLTRRNKELILNIALNYGGRADIVQAIKKLVIQGAPAKKIDEFLVGKNLWTGKMPNPDLIIRTAGEQRISNFLIWQGAYAELYFLRKYWPEFTEQDLNEALEEYQARQRRFGK